MIGGGGLPLKGSIIATSVDFEPSIGGGTRRVGFLARAVWVYHTAISLAAKKIVGIRKTQPGIVVFGAIISLLEGRMNCVWFCMSLWNDVASAQIF